MGSLVSLSFAMGILSIKLAMQKRIPPHGWMVNKYWNLLEYIYIYVLQYVVELYFYLWRIYIYTYIHTYIHSYIHMYIISNPENNSEEIDLSMLPPFS